MCVCTYVVSMYVCMYACMHVHLKMYVCMFVAMHVYSIYARSQYRYKDTYIYVDIITIIIDWAGKYWAQMQQALPGRDPKSTPAARSTRIPTS